MFHLAISLWMIDSGCCDFDAKEVIQLVHELQHELWATIRQDRKQNSVEFPDMLQVECNRFNPVQRA